MGLAENVSALATRIAQEVKAKANNALVVHNTGDETVQGIKTVPAGSNNQWVFNQAPSIAQGTIGSHPARRDDSRFTDPISAGRLPVVTGSPVTENVATSTTPDASLGSLRNYVCSTATLTIGIPTNPADRQVLKLAIDRSTAASMTVTFNSSIRLSTGLSSRTFTIASGQVLFAALEYSTLIGAWVLTAATVSVT